MAAFLVDGFARSGYARLTLLAARPRISTGNFLIFFMAFSENVEPSRNSVGSRHFRQQCPVH